ncbi:MAG TPA: potassium transporter Kup, partial [Desulfarculaceae bacterium]|nr:potassium transporter Kup [Desulfarculaceae bacterium]
MAVENSKKSADKPESQHLATLSLAALGVVFGDIGTSPIYAIRECFHGEYGIIATPANVLGVLSLMFWALTIIVSLKYLTFILQADNNGEGGVIALTSLIRPQGLRKLGMRPVLVSFGLFAACLLYGDGMITPAISVLSALEGLKVISPDFTPFIIPLTIIILVALFLLQSRGTAKMGKLFGPVIFIWFSVLALLGIGKIVACPRILTAFMPWHGVEFLLHNHLHGFLVLGAVFLVVTGAEALYADLGHFGPRPIRLVWIFFVLP